MSLKKKFLLITTTFSLISFVNLPVMAAIQKTFGMIKPSGLAKEQEIKNIILSHGLIIKQEKRIIFTEKHLNKLYFMHKDKPFFNELKTSLVGKEVIPMVIYGQNAVATYREAVSDIRAKYAVNKTDNAVHGADEWHRAHEEICIFFDCATKNKKKNTEQQKEVSKINDTKDNDKSLNNENQDQQQDGENLQQ